MNYLTKNILKIYRRLNQVSPRCYVDLKDPTTLKLSSKKINYSTVAAATCLRKDLKLGSEIFGFKITEVKDVPELQLRAIRLEHLHTGANYLHIARDDSNNVFCVGFRTTPMDSTGVPHILEHTVLCGSEKYPCRDPFFKMLNRSLSTFMNAMTGSDYTMYPFSTQNSVDFQNLMQVYMDATFKPNLSELDFLQEGWRLEHENPDDVKSDIVIKGVVFNEMKGVFADSQQTFVQKLQNGLMPYHTYGYISGGDPMHIPNLTWNELKQFHTKHYHPSNARFFTYGDQPLEDHLKFIHENYLIKYSKMNPETSVPNEPVWTQSQRTHISCGFDPMVSKENQSNLAVSFLLMDIKDLDESFTMSIIGELLMGGSNAPFYKSLIETQYGSSFVSGSGFDANTRNVSFTIGLQGTNDEQFEEILKAIEDTFDKIILEGFDQEQLAAILHNIELGIKHQSSNFGLGLIMSLTPLWNHDGNIVEAIQINKKLQDFKQNLRENPKLLEEKVKKYFINNKHKFVLSMSPEENYEEKLKKVESDNLEKVVETLTDENKIKIFEMGQLLKKQQELKEDISCLPTLQVSDIARHVKPTVVKELLQGSVPLYLCEQPTNGVTYFRTVLDTSQLPPKFQNLIPLLTSILTEMGAGDLDYRMLSQKAELVCGGLCSNVHITEHPDNLSKYEQGIILSSHCLQKNIQPMLGLWTKIFNQIRMDDLSHFSTLIKMMAADQANSLVHNGHGYAMSFSASTASYVSHIRERWGGLTYMETLKQLSETSDLSETLNDLKVMVDILLKQNNLRVSVNTSPEYSEQTVKHIDHFLTTLHYVRGSNSCMKSVPSGFTATTCHTHHVFPFPVNFAAKTFPSVAYTHPDSGALRVLARLMFQFLHREIREKGGAYGGGAMATPGGPFNFFSYRDPHSTQTLETFDGAVESIIKGEFTQRDVDEAKLGVFQKVDSPISPGSKGLRPFFTHISDDMFNTHRETILDARPEDLIRVCQTYLRDSPMKSSCLIGPANDLLSQDPSWRTKVHG